LCNRDHVRHRQTQTDTERDRSWKHTHPPRDKQDDDAVHAISRGPQGGREGDLGPVHDRHNRRWSWILLPFLFLFFLVCCLCPAPSLPLCLVLSFFLCWIASFLHSFLPFFLRRRKIIVLPLFLHFRWHQEHTCSNTICN
jgi:hypothetical protein